MGKKRKILILVIGIINILGVYSQDKLVNANNNFAFKIYKATRPDSTNFFISPFSLHLALAITNEGAKTTTRQEIDKLLSIVDMDNRAIEYKDLIKKTIWSDNESGENALYLANSLWINNGFQIDKNYKQTIEDKYYSKVFDFDKNNILSANQKLNSWVSNETHDKIKEISGLTPEIKLSILNAIYFMGEWEVPFKKNKTILKNFHSITRDENKVDFMNEQSIYKYYEDGDIQSLILPYKRNQFSMIVLLPQERYGISKIEEKISLDYLNKVLKSSFLKEVIISLPKFKIETEISLKKDIIKMGYGEMFSDKADFTNISTNLLRIDKFTHKTFIEIDERKTEAFAVSKVDMVMITGLAKPTPPAPKIFNADHPFVFAIVDNRTKAIIFIGRFVKK